jgi:hypothetical protein
MSTGLSAEDDILLLANILAARPKHLSDERLVLYSTLLARYVLHVLSKKLAKQSRPAGLFAAFVGLKALHDYKPNSINGELFAAAAEALIATEVQPGGPYLSATHTEGSILANASIALFMTSLGSPLPKVQAYLEHVALLTKTGDLLLSPATHRYLNSALGNVPSGQSEAVNDINPLDPASRRQLDFILRQSTEYIEASPLALQPALATAFASIQAADNTTHEIGLLSHFFFTSLAPGSSQLIKNAQPFCQTYGTANIFCWIAYTAYDNIIDAEIGSQDQLPIANLAHRLAYDLYCDSTDDSAALKIVRSTFNAMDAANQWELQACRPTITGDSITLNSLPDYQDCQILADRSGAHILGPLLLALQLNLRTTSPAWIALREGLRHYLIARQLQDDLHDWADDLRNGQLSYVAADLLRQLHIKPDVYNLDVLIGHLKQAFWDNSLPKQCETILFHTSAAKSQFALTKLFSSTQSNSTLYLVERLENAAIQTNQDYLQRRDFVEHYTTV